jgi:hypothetical protein
MEVLDTKNNGQENALNAYALKRLKCIHALKTKSKFWIFTSQTKYPLSHIPQRIHMPPK